jgi:hypothetical protein
MVWLLTGAEDAVNSAIALFISSIPESLTLVMMSGFAWN